MNDRVRCPGWSPLDRADAVVAAALSGAEPQLVSAEPGPIRDDYVDACLRAASGKRILIFAPDETAAAPVRARLAAEMNRMETATERDRHAVAKAAAERTLADADRELATLLATATVKPGFFARLFGLGGQTKLIAGRIAEWEAKRSAADAELRRLELRMLARVLDSGHPAPEDSERKRDRVDHSSDVSHATPLPLSPDEFPIASLTDAFAPTLYNPATVRVATPADVPFVGFVADLAITLAAERVTACEFDAIRAVSPAHVVIGDPTPAVSNSPYRNGIPTAFRSDFFADRWATARLPAWGREDGRIVCRLETSPDASRAELRCEPLLDRPEFELRFLPGDEPKLVEVAFPDSFAAAACRTWLAAELGEARPVARGPAQWNIGEMIRAVWPHADGTAGEWIESVPGVREWVVGTDYDAATAELRFDPAAGWTRESAEAWVNEMLALSMSPTVVLPTVVPPTTPVKEPALEFATAG